MSAFCTLSQAGLSPQQTTEQMNLNDACGIYRSHSKGWRAEPGIHVLFSIFKQEGINDLCKHQGFP